MQLNRAQVIGSAVFVAGVAAGYFSLVGSIIVIHVSGRRLLFSAVALVLTLAAAIVAEYLLRRNAARQSEQNKQAMRRAFSQEVERVFTVKSPVTLTFRKRDREDLGLLLSTSPPYENAVADFRRQLAAITDRLEKQRNEIAEVQKIDPVLEATLKVGVENLTKRIETLEKKQLEKWDVALVCFALISALGVVITVILGMAKYFLGK